jgi:hypothetical protein
VWPGGSQGGPTGVLSGGPTGLPGGGPTGVLSGGPTGVLVGGPCGRLTGGLTGGLPTSEHGGGVADAVCIAPTTATAPSVGTNIASDNEANRFLDAFIRALPPCRQCVPARTLTHRAPAIHRVIRDPADGGQVFLADDASCRTMADSCPRGAMLARTSFENEMPRRPTNPARAARVGPARRPFHGLRQEPFLTRRFALATCARSSLFTASVTAGSECCPLGRGRSGPGSGPRLRTRRTGRRLVEQDGHLGLDESAGPLLGSTMQSAGWFGLRRHWTVSPPDRQPIAWCERTSRERP